MSVVYLNSKSGGGVNFPPLVFFAGDLNENDFTFEISQSRPACVIDGDYIKCTESTLTERNGFKLIPKDSTKKYGVVIDFYTTEDNTWYSRYQLGRCNLNADPYLCVSHGTGRISYNEGSFAGVGDHLISYVSVKSNEAFFCTFTPKMFIKSITIYEVCE